MGRGKDISPRKLSEVKTLLLHTSNTQKKVAELTGVSISMVNKIKISLERNLTLSPKRKGHSGRKRMTTPRDDRKIRDICLRNRKKSAAHLTQMVQESGVAVSKRTVQRRLAEEGLTGHRPTKKPRLTDAMKRRRFTWAREHSNMTVEDWNRVKYAFLINTNSFLMII